VTTSRKFEDLRAAEALPNLRLVILVDGADLPSSPGLDVLPWSAIEAERDDAIAARPAIETDPAYLLYTSGSTGKPKGVILTHRHARTFIDWGVDLFDIRPSDKLSNHAPNHFDLSVFDIYAAMKAGASVNPVPDEVNSFPLQLAQWIDSFGITVWYSVPSALIRMLLHGKLERFEFARLRHVLFAGEVFPVKYLRDFQAKLPKMELWNLYGPTETNVCTYYKVPLLPADQATEIPIGRACENTDVFALTDDGQVAGPGGVGELVVRGPSVMPGYWGLPERTAQSLVPNPIQPSYGELIYKTGDYVKLREDGDYDFIGRKDNQVKSRGYRIELGDVEQAVYRHEAVREAAVVAVPDAEIGAKLKLVLVTHTEGALTRKDIEAFCQLHLPRYMVPEIIEFRSSLPRTSTGKTDRQALQNEAVPS
jgi:amino acid adenylation domain-containing protein